MSRGAAKNGKAGKPRKKSVLRKKVGKVGKVYGF